MIELKRMFVNQPSTLQPYHDLHGVNVLAVKETDEYYRAYFLSGSVVSMQILTRALSDGWV